MDIILKNKRDVFNYQPFLICQICSDFFFPLILMPLFWEVFNLRILTVKKLRQIKLQRVQKVGLWVFGSLVHQILYMNKKSVQEVLKLKQSFQKNKVVADKTLFFVIGPYCTHHSICLNIGFWCSSFVWQWCAFNFSAFS